MATRVETLGFAALLLCAAPATAAAQSPDGRFKLGIEASLFEYTTRENDVQSAASPVADSATEGVSFGVTSARTGVDFGYGLANWAVVGSRLLLLHDSAEAPGGTDQDSTMLAFVPHFDFVFPSRSNTRIFAGPTAGIALDVRNQNDASTTLFIFGAGFGAHIFAAKGVSLDPRLSLSYAFGKSTFDDDTGSTPIEVRSDVRVISMSALLGISAWL